MSKWIYKYRRSDHNWVFHGLYNTKTEAQKDIDRDKEAGIYCSEPIEVPDDYKIQECHD